jgi:hypothetical protein
MLDSFIKKLRLKSLISRDEPLNDIICTCNNCRNHARIPLSSLKVIGVDVSIKGIFFPFKLYCKALKQTILLRWTGLSEEEFQIIYENTDSLGFSFFVYDLELLYTNKEFTKNKCRSDVLNTSHGFQISGYWPKYLCRSCIEYNDNLIALSKELCFPIDNCSLNIIHDDKDYVVRTKSCWKCSKITPVYTWKGAPYAKETPPNPVPDTIKYKYSKTAKDSYWVNVCIHCQASQGDNFLYFGNKPIFVTSEDDWPHRSFQIMNPPATISLEQVLKY